MRDRRPHGWPGAPLEPTGNPMLDGVGPALYAKRADVPDLTLDGAAEDRAAARRRRFGIASADPDPRGMDVVGGDGKVAGIVSDVWVDRAEPQVRYLEVEVDRQRAAACWCRCGFAKVDGPRPLRRACARSWPASSPTCRALRNPDQVTLREEDRISAYYGGGTLYAEPKRIGTAAVSEHEFEPIPGLPERLPAGERMLWQGRPWRALARAGAPRAQGRRLLRPAGGLGMSRRDAGRRGTGWSSRARRGVAAWCSALPPSACWRCSPGRWRAARSTRSPRSAS